MVLVNKTRIIIHAILTSIIMLLYLTLYYTSINTLGDILYLTLYYTMLCDILYLTLHYTSINMLGDILYP